MSTKIEWCDETWNPVTGCTPISEGCKNCYAKRMTARNLWGYDFWPGTEHMDRLEEPLHWRKRRRIFVCSMGDLFHRAVGTPAIDRVRGVILECPQHAFMLLTKRPQRMLTYTNGGQSWPSNVWLGVTAEKQKRADERIPILLQIPAAHRFVSVEPMLGPVSLQTYLVGHEDNGVAPGRPVGTCVGYTPPLDWVICGAETGPGARYMDPLWAKRLRDECGAARVPFFFKKGSQPKDTDISVDEVRDLMVREFP
jgi:protein gp37